MEEKKFEVRCHEYGDGSDYVFETFETQQEAQAFMDQYRKEHPDDALYEQLYYVVKVVKREKKTFLLKWNPEISNFKMDDFHDVMFSLGEDAEGLSWSIWDWKEARKGDRVYLLKVGQGKTGIVMAGEITDEPYPAEDWSGKGCEVYYVNFKILQMINPEYGEMLTTEMLEERFPGVEWNGGHSGVVLESAIAKELDKFYQSFLVEHKKQFRVSERYKALTTEAIIDDYKEFIGMNPENSRPEIAMVQKESLNLGDKFDTFSVSLKKCKNEKGIVEINLPGYIGDEPYTFKAGLGEIKQIFLELEDVLKSKRNKFQFVFKDIKRDKWFILGYQPTAGVLNDAGKEIPRIFKEKQIDQDLPGFKFSECGFFFILSCEGLMIQNFGFTHREKFVRDFYLGLKDDGTLNSESQKIIDFFMKKKPVSFEYKGYKCEASFDKKSLQYAGTLTDDSGNLLKHCFMGDYESDFITMGRKEIDSILSRRASDLLFREWKKTPLSTLVSSVFNLQPERFQELAESGKFDLHFLVPGFYEVPLAYVTKAYDVLLKGYMMENLDWFETEYGDGGRSVEDAIKLNDEIKQIWKDQAGIDIDALEVDFSQFNAHIAPQVSKEEEDRYFYDIPDGICEWIISGIFNPQECCAHDATSCLMEYMAHLR